MVCVDNNNNLENLLPFVNNPATKERHLCTMQLCKCERKKSPRNFCVTGKMLLLLLSSLLNLYYY
ncbi:hypothetical protein EXN66_Car020439 [Channa argus]|uniref:Uncharacterized protein n=1 Tax=Channa argus TaxID=215402 RepID=A0A6G1QQZ3_CHAAH|nr:hypothetical protein EXN66_Car020439 [Channa argus]